MKEGRKTFLKEKGKLSSVTQCVSRKHSIGQKQFYIETNLRLPFSFCLAEAGSGQDYVTSENQLLYYPSITYAIIGSSVIFVLVVAFLALVLHHQRKRNNLMTLPVHRLQHPVLLSRLVVLDHPHHCSVTYNVNNGIQYVASQPYHRPVDLDSPPSYSEAVLDQRYVQELILGPPKRHSADCSSGNVCCCSPLIAAFDRSPALDFCHLHRVKFQVNLSSLCV